MLFCETSAKTGRGVQESLQSMARYAGGSSSLY